MMFKNKKICIFVTCVLILVFCSVMSVGCSKSYNNVELLSDEQKYAKACEIMTSNPEESIDLFNQISDYSNSSTYSKNVYNVLGSSIAGGFTHSVAITRDGKVLATNYTGEKKYDKNKCDVSEWQDIIDVDASGSMTVGLRSDGTVIVTNDNSKLMNKIADKVSSWQDIVMVACGEYHVLGLKSDGTVVAAGSNDYGQLDVSKWDNVIKICSSGFYSVALKNDGTVVHCGSSLYEMIYSFYRLKTNKWTDIVDIDVSDYHLVGLKSDGTAVATGYNDKGSCDVEDWKGIVAVAAGDAHSVGLRNDGTVINTSFYVTDEDEECDIYAGQCDVSEWRDIVAISAGSLHTLGLKKDGTVISTEFIGDKEYENGQTTVNHFVNIGPYKMNERKFVSIVNN